MGTWAHPRNEVVGNTLRNTQSKSHFAVGSVIQLVMPVLNMWPWSDTEIRYMLERKPRRSPGPYIGS